MAYPDLKINSGLVNSYAWLQKGYTYGVNDSGPWQRFAREGLTADVQNWAATLNDAGWTWTVTLLHHNHNTGIGIARVEASAGWAYPYLYGTETPENIWELDPQDEQKALLESDFPNGTVDLTSNKSRDALAKIIEDTTAYWCPAGSTQNPTGYGIVSGSATIWAFDDGNLTIPGGAAVTASGGVVTVPTTETRAVVHLPSADYAPAYSLYLLMRAGNTVFPVEASVIRHSQVTSNIYAVQASYNNFGRLISTNSMYSLEGTPSQLLFAVPTLPSPQQFIETAGDLQYAWRKTRPHVSRLSRMKWRTVQNYQLGLWPVKTFGSVL